ncbi:hypothetical protein LSTR_LSTR006885 [Laodelphax striatellus]|uniref:Uncharacterized protein n=1 Tax=Laodelphax striatellus TaxID=195883 RepID=A0A482XEA6_LAOST|nr:hypothetical protein LSTR_LSTR006885 [Laodelphax striatellus]
MDLIYMSDAMAYQSIRGQFSFYDRSWDQKQAEKPQVKSEKKRSFNGEHGKDGCPICKEQRKRRSLQAYIRTKSHEEIEEKAVLSGYTKHHQTELLGHYPMFDLRAHHVNP